MGKYSVQEELDWLRENEADRMKRLGSSYVPQDGWVNQKVARAYKEALNAERAAKELSQDSVSDAELSEMEAAQDAKIEKLEAEGKTLVGTENEKQRNRKRRVTRLDPDTVTPAEKIAKTYEDGAPILLTRYDDNAIAEAFIAAHPRLGLMRV